MTEEVRQFILKLNEAKDLHDRILEIEEEFFELERRLTDDDVRFLFRHITHLVLNDIIVAGLGECLAESIQYYEKLNPDEEMPITEHQDESILPDLLWEIAVTQNRHRNRD